jgi:hypothetical protein
VEGIIDTEKDGKFFVRADWIENGCMIKEFV